MPVEMADRDTVVPMVTVADTATRSSTSWRRWSPSVAGTEPARRSSPRAAWSVDPITVVPARGLLRAAQTVAADSRRPGQRRAVAPYPPGVPVLAPGELVTADAVDALRAARAAGSRIAYAADPTVHTLDVIAE